MSLRGLFGRLTGRADHAAADRGTVTYDPDFFGSLRSNLANAEEWAGHAEQEALRWSRATDEADQLLGDAQMHRSRADRLAGRLAYETACRQAQCDMWGWSMPDRGENGWAR